MTRNLKALGIALVAVLVVGGIAAQVGSAGGEEHEFITTGQESAVLTGEQITEGISHHEYTERLGEIEQKETGIGKLEEEIEAEESKIKKEEEAIEKTETEIANFHSEVKEPLFFKIGSSNALSCQTAIFNGLVMGQEIDTVALYPEYNNCEWASLFAATITVNGCTYILGSDTTESPSAEFDAPMSIVCPEGNKIKIDVSTCEIHIPAQEGLHGVRYKALEKDGPEERDALQITATVAGMNAVSTGGFGCAVIGLPLEFAEYNNFGYEGKIIVTGYEVLSAQEEHDFPDEGRQVDWTIE